jgi:hypothetical protein
VIRTIIVGLIAILLLSGCGDFWRDQGRAAVGNATARQSQARAAQQNAEAAIIDAEARGAMAESQARALEQSVGAVVDLADDGEYVAVFAGIALAALVLAGVTVWAVMRRPVPVEKRADQDQLKIAVIEMADGVRWQLEQGPQESHAAFLLRLQLLAVDAAQREQQLLLAAPRER